METTIKGRTATNGGTIWQTPQGDTALVSVGYVINDVTIWQTVRGYGKFAETVNSLKKGEIVEVSGFLQEETKLNKSTLRNYDVEILVAKSIRIVSTSKKLVLKKK